MATTTVNPYADRAMVQMMAANQPQVQPAQTVQQEPANLFAQQKMAGYPGVNTPKAGQRVAGEAGTVHTNPVNEPTESVRLDNTRPTTAAVRNQDTSAPIRNTDELARAMGYTSPEEEERLRKASVANQRIMAVADAIRHIGNIANTVNGAPSMQFNNPVKEEYDRYLKGKAMRDAANYKYLSYQQQKAAQDQKIRQWEAEQEYKRGKDERDFRFNTAKTAADFAEKQRQYNEGLAYRKANDEANRKQRGEYQDKQIALGKQRIGLGWANHKESVRYHNEMLKQKENGVGRKTSTGRGNGYTYSTRRGSVTIPADYLSKNKINKRSLLTAMERAGAIDTEWLDNYDRAVWNEKQQEQMLDDAVSNWLMTDDAAEDYMVKHLKGQSSWTESNSKSNPYGDNSGKGKSGNHKSNPYG